MKEEPPADETDKAIAQAKATGGNVPIDSLTTEFSETVATPAGHLQLTEHPDQQRMKRNGTWVPLDATLVTNSDGTFSPKAAAGSLVLSKGGDGPLATMTSGNGKKLAITAPFSLPAPTVNGDVLTYADVAPDTDLQVTATKFGGLTTVVVLKTRAAAANPVVRDLHFGTTADGVTLSADKSGALTASGSNGAVLWTAPTPQMWDSSTAPTSAAEAAARTADAGAPTANVPTTDAQEHSRATSTQAGPGDGAKVTQMPVKVNADGIDLTPDQNLLAHGTAPFYIDPAWIPYSNQASAWTWVQAAYPNLSNWDRSGSADTDHPGVGLCGYYAAGGSCSPTDTYRSFFQFDTGALNGTTIYSATLTFSEYVSADWSCTNTYPLDLYLTGGISNATTWSNQPGQAGGRLGEDTIGGSGNGACHDNVPFSYDVTSTFQQYAGTYPNLTFGLYGNESNDNAFKRLTTNPSLTVSYDRAPNLPTNPNVTPAPKTISPSRTTQSCGDGNSADWAWLGAGSDRTGAVAINGTVSSPTQAQLYSWSHIWDYNLPGTPDVASGLSSPVPNNSTASFTIPAGVIKDGHSYGYSLMATDNLPGAPWSGATPTCFFKVDLTPPTISFPPVTDLTTQFPPSGSGQVSKLLAGQQGYIPFSATDPNPSGLNSSGVACVTWGPDPQLSDQTTTTACGSAIPANQLPVKPGHWGTNVIYVRAQDNAGNLSPVAQYSFYAAWNPNGPPPAFGNVTGDSVPDIVTADTAGNLRAYTVPGNPLATSVNTADAAKAASSPDGDSWADYRVTHRGSLRGGMNVDDLIVHKDGEANLYFYPNPGNTGIPGVFDSHSQLTKPACDPTVTDCTGYDATNWSTTTQIAALGDPSTTNLDTNKKFQNRTGLLTVEASPDGNGALWYYPTISDATFGSPIKIAATGWKNLQLISPGDWAKQGHPGLWARDVTNGNLYAYTFNLGSGSITDQFGNASTYPIITSIATTATVGNVPYTSAPAMGSDGDLTGAGTSALWAITPSGGVELWTSTVTGTTTAPSLTWNGPSTVLNTSLGADQWPLNAANTNNGIATDSTGQNPLTLPSSPTWTTDHKGNANAAAAFNGSGSMFSTQTTGIWGIYNLTAGTVLNPGQRVTAVNMTLTMQTDGNLILAALNSPTVLWASGTYNHPGATATMQPDGNFVIYDTNRTALWATGTNNNPGALLRLQSDHNLAVYTASNQPIWQSGTFNATYNTPIAVATNGAAVDTSTSYTLSAWVRLDGSTGSDQSFVCQNGDTLPPINLQYMHASQAWGALAPSQDDWNAAWPAVASANGSATTGNWTHLAVTYSADTHALTLYVNGTYAGSTTQSTPWGASTTPNAARAFTIGACYMNNNTTVINKLDGAVSDVRSYPYAMTTQQITALYNS
ncbi:LamG-like jellyroll fold domain-containing protein [Kitasatospora sp. NPDC052896]|uniref:LamG-like jellyroll fold domain-containing protein n=1 Tax=Kitasatospora sp. NPDC052896 TaxID=3364061 RepID=UPI0037C6AD29